MKKVNLISLGCAKNLVDSEKLLGCLAAAGIEVTPSLKDSDLVIINTCGFIKPALHETENEIERVLKRAKEKKVFVYGCAVNRYKSELQRKYPGVSAWFSLKERKRLLNKIIKTSKEFESRLVTTKGYAYLQIADGCSNYCSYCTIPLIRGSFRSVGFEKIIEEAKELARLGIKELILIAQDTGRYGIDNYGRPMLIPLIKELSKIEDITWIRILYAHPKNVSDGLISEIRENPKVCKYLDMPIQHINNRILRLMNRQVKRKELEQLVKEIKKNDISLRTSVIAGFPTETEQEFNELVAFLQMGYFDWLGVLPYSCEPETEASKLAQMPAAIIRSRYQRLLEIQQDLIARKNRIRLGRSYKTLIHQRNGNYIGHTEFAAPEIDSQIIVESTALVLGNFYDLRIRKVKGVDLYA